MAKDLNKEESVATQDLKDADTVNQQDLTADTVNQQNQDKTLADGTSKNKSVPYAELEKATKAKNEAEEQAAYAQRQLELMQQQTLVNANPPQQPKSSMEQALIDCGVTADELYDGETQVKVMNRKDQIDNARFQQQQHNFSLQQFIVQHPDINQVVGSVNPATGQIMTISPELMALLAKKPHYAGATLQIAYDAVIQERALNKFAEKQAALKEHQDRQDIDNKTLPLGGSAAGGSGAGESQNSKLMTQEQVDTIRAKINSGEIL